ncbi:MAG: hypothetical protein ABI634_05235 [Acidobacteriota bacterium]
MTMDHDELEHLIDRELRDLPAPRAPRSLLSRVMAAGAEAQRPWYARAWRTWPVGWQAASVVLCLALLTVTGLSLPIAQASIAAESAPMIGRVTTDVWQVIARTMDAQRAAEIVWRVVIGPVASVAVLPILAMLVASLAFGAALSRLAFGGTPQS